GAAEDASVRAGAVHLVAHVLDGLPALGLRAGAEERVVATEGLGVLARRRDAPLDAREGGLHLSRADALDAVLARPALEHLLRRTPRHTAVHHRRAADAAALGEEDRRHAERHRGAAVAVELGRHRRRRGVELFGRVVAALLEDDDVEAALGELGGDDAPAGAPAPDDRGSLA